MASSSGAESGRLVVADAEHTAALGDHIKLVTTDGHTPGMLHTIVTGLRQSAFFCADFVPGAAWVHVPITMGYDRYPEMLIDEKARLLARRHRRAAEERGQVDDVIEVAPDVDDAAEPRARQGHGGDRRDRNQLRRVGEVGEP